VGDLEVVEICFRCARIPLDCFIFVLYMRMINYFVVRKRTKMSSELLPFTWRHRLLVAFAFFMGVMALYTTIISSVLQLLENLLDSGAMRAYGIDAVNNVQYYLIWQVNDLLMATGVLYLFFTLGRASRRIDLKGKASRSDLSLSLPLKPDEQDEDEDDPFHNINKSSQEDDEEEFDEEPMINSL
jgi:hypothetical protein